LQRINNAIKDGSFFNSQALIKAAEHIKKNNSKFHIMGIAGSGSVHGYLDHLFALMEFAQRNNISKVYLHLFTDGRDSPPNEAPKILEIIESKSLELGVGKIATIIGRNYAMDRDEDWSKIEKTYKLLIDGAGLKVSNAISAIKDFYQKNIYDEMIEPLIIVNENIKDNEGLIQDNDVAVFLNFREDSARELTRAFVEKNFKFFKRRPINNLLFLTMTEYQKLLPVDVIMPPLEIKNCLGEVLSLNNKNQLRIAETEKYAHVTLFFNGGREIVFPGEERVLITSFPVNKIEHHPEMKAKEIVEKYFEWQKKKIFDFSLINFANADMLGHTGNLEAAKKGIEVIDTCLAKIMKNFLEKDEILIVTSDHGNAEEMINFRTGEIDTEHNANPVPFWLIGNKYRRRYPRTREEINSIYNNSSGMLADVAPTILGLFGIQKPIEMTGNDLLRD